MKMKRMTVAASWAALLSLGLGAEGLCGADLGYNASSGNWTTAANWNPTLATPATGDRVFLGGGFVGGQAATTNVTLNSDVTAVTVSEIWVGSLGVGGANSGTLTVQSGALLNTNGRMRVGGGVTGFVNQSGGTITWLGGDLVVGDNSGGSGTGTYTMTGGTITGLATLFLGNGTQGTFNNQGGTIVSPGTLQTLASPAAFNQTAGSSSFTQMISNGATFNFDLSGGTYTTSGGQFAAGANFVGTLTGGTMTTGFLNLGYNGSATFTQSGGDWNVPGGAEIWIGNNSAPSTYNMQGGTLSQTGGRFIVGTFTTGIVNHTGGTITANQFEMGLYGGTGDYNLSGGALIANSMQLGLSNPSTFDFTGGRLDANSILFGLVNNGGLLSPDLLEDVGTTNLTTTYTQNSGSLEIDLASNVSFDTINVTGVATLNGSVIVNLMGAYVPTIGQMWDVLVASSISDLGLTVTSADGIFSHSIVGSNTLRLIYEGPLAVPEPASMILVGLAALLLSPVRRRA